MRLLIRHPRGHDAERGYAYDLVLRKFLGIEFQTQVHDLPEVHFVLPEDPFGRFLRVADVFFQVPNDEWLTTASLPRLPLATCTVPISWDPHKRLVDHRLPVLFGRPRDDGHYLAETRRDITIGVDVFGSAFFMLTRYEEMVTGPDAPQRDAHDRFPAAASVAYRAGFLHRPLIDEYVILLERALNALHPALPASRGEPGRLLLSHDVDRPRMHDDSATWPDVVARSWREIRAGAAPRGVHRLTSYAVNRDPYDTFGFLLDQSDRVGARATFNVMTGCSDPRFDPGYDVDAPHVRELLRMIDRRGHAVGFHPSYRTSTDFALAQREHEALRRVLAEENIDQGPLGGRQHFLRWHNPTTWRNWSELGADHDATLGFADHVGFRCGTCRPYPVFDLEARRSLDLREHPLVATDSALLQYMGLTPADARDRVADLAETCRRVGGSLTLLVHNSNLFTKVRRRWYADVLEAAA